jgi:hypothetical protein
LIFIEDHYTGCSSPSVGRLTIAAPLRCIRAHSPPGEIWHRLARRPDHDRQALTEKSASARRPRIKQPVALPIPTTDEPFRFARLTLDSGEEVPMTMRLILAGLLFLSVGTGLSGCVVRERTVAARPGTCPGGYWIEGHYGPRGRWHPGHWRCPGVVERIEID